MDKKQNKKHINSVPLDTYEKELAEFLNQGEYVSSKNLNETKKMFLEAVKRHNELRKTKRITLRVNREDLIKVKVKAKKNSIPYQRLINALIHGYAQDRTRIEL